MAYEALKAGADRALSKLGLVKVGDVVMTAAEAKARSSAPAQPAAKGAPAPRATMPGGSGMPADSAKARAAERQRWETVMLSDRVKGRERFAAAMLASGDDSAATILAKLGDIRTDAERERANAIARQNAAAAVWDKAIAQEFGR